MIADKLFNFFYSALALTVLLFPGHVFPVVYFIAKPLIMISLFLWAVITPDARQVAGKKVLLTGMVFACAGDCFLMFPDYFMEGLGAFLMMQWCYFAAFKKDFTRRTGIRYAVLSLIPVLLFTGVLLSRLLPEITDTVLSAAVILYAFSIGMMLWISLLRKSSAGKSSFAMVASGAVLFTISDTLIAWNKFVVPVDHGHLLIMSTYMAAQYLITRGMLKIPG